jgi:hypothetical protein
MKAQTIQIDSTFTADGEIFPFENIEIISGLSAGGEVDLNSDTSQVRIIQRLILISSGNLIGGTGMDKKGRRYTGKFVVI